MLNYQNVRLGDNFYPASSCLSTAQVIISTLAEDGSTALGSYSLCYPYYIAGEDYYAMVLGCRNNSNTSQHILRYGKCAINFLAKDENCINELLGFELIEDVFESNISKFKFTLERGLAEEVEPAIKRPLVVKEALQVFECTWISELEGAFNDKPGIIKGYDPPYRSYNGITSKFGAHFVLKIDKILMREKYLNGTVNGAKENVSTIVNGKYLEKVRW